MKFNRRDALSIAGTIGLLIALLAGSFGGEPNEEMASQAAQLIGVLAAALGYGGASLADAADRGKTN